MDAEQQRGQAEVDEEDDHAKVDHWVGCLDEPLPLTDEYDGRSKAALGHAENKITFFNKLHS